MRNDAFHLDGLAAPAVEGGIEQCRVDRGIVGGARRASSAQDPYGSASQGQGGEARGRPGRGRERSDTEADAERQKGIDTDAEERSRDESREGRSKRPRRRSHFPSHRPPSPRKTPNCGRAKGYTPPCSTVKRGLDVARQA